MAYKWKFMCRLEPKGHRLFLSELSHRVAVADNSGASPEQTEDGVLWFDPTRPIDVGKNDCAVPLLDDAGRKSHTATGHLGAARLVQMLRALYKDSDPGAPDLMVCTTEPASFTARAAAHFIKRGVTEPEI